MVPVDPERLGQRTEEGVNVNFPFVIEVEHPALDLLRMFQLTEAFDLYEMRKDPTGEADRVKEVFLVDVLEIEPKRTVMKITPAEPMFYSRLARHVVGMIERVGKEHFKGALKPIRIHWEIAKTGVASDLRGMLRSVH